MKELTIRIDGREIEEIFILANSLAYELETKAKINIVKEQLICGDAIIGDIVYERKEAGDFVASIVDGRLQEQAAKMALNFKHIYFVIVGSIWDTTSNINPRAVVGAQISMAVRFGAKFIHVPNDDLYIWAIYSIANKHQDGKIFNPEEHEIIAYEKNPASKHIAMLAASGIGKERARAIAEFCKYDIRKVVNMSEKELCEVKGIGKKTAKEFKKVMLGDW